MISTLLLAAVLTLSDPAGDAVGDGNLVYPTAEVFRAPGTLDARELSVHESDGFTVSLRMAQVSNPWNLPGGFSLPIIELYLNTREEGGRAALLPGSGMRLPDGAVWHYALRLTGESLELLRAGEGGIEDVTARYDVRLTAEDTLLTVTSSLPRPRHFSLYGVVGSYDPWDPTRWRRVMPEAETFAFGNPRQAATGIRAVDILADSLETQISAIHSGVLPEIRPPNQQGLWPPVIAAGLALALLGTAGRVVVGHRRAGAAARAPTPAPSIGYGAPPAPYEPAPPRRLEPVDLLAGLPPLRQEAKAGPERALPAPGQAKTSSGATARPRVGVYDAPEPAPAAEAARGFAAPPDAPLTNESPDDWTLADDWADERDALWPDAAEEPGRGRSARQGEESLDDPEVLEVVEAELVDSTPWDEAADDELQGAPTPPASTPPAAQGGSPDEIR